jgi:hypothetical protein
MFEMGRIPQRLASPPPPKVEVSQTPKPMKPLGNSAAATPKSTGRALGGSRIRRGLPPG